MDQNPETDKNVENKSCMFSPRFRSTVAMAGWDEETLLLASLVVEDTPDRETKQRKRTPLIHKSPTTSSRRKRRSRRQSPTPIPSTIFILEDESDANEEGNSHEKKVTEVEIKEEKREEQDKALPAHAFDPGPNSNLPCLDRLREELSCAICLEICFEPSTTPCGHSFCKRCLRSAADKCGKRCPKCRQLISNGRACTVNTVLWNTIQLLFPVEIKAKKATANDREQKEQQSPKNGDQRIGRAVRVSIPSIASSGSTRRRVPSQEEDAALAFRLQREEFLGAYRGTHEQQRISHAYRGTQVQQRSSLSFARANLRAMASRAVQLRTRGRPA